MHTIAQVQKKRRRLSTILRIGELERLCGVPRTTIYFYTRRGLVPPPHKIGRSRALYGDPHVRALTEVKRLKDAGLTLEEISRELQGSARVSASADVDLVAQLEAETRLRILATATRHFATQGYAGTRVAQIIRELGMAPSIFYRYFPNKRKLFLDTVESFSVRWFEEHEAWIKLEPDIVRRQMLRASAFLGLLGLSPDLLTFIRAEAMTHRRESREALLRTYRRMMEPLLEDFAELRRKADRVSSHEDELLAMAWLGVLENTAMRVAWDKKYSEADYYWVTLQTILPILEGYSGQRDIRREPRFILMVDSLVSAGAISASDKAGKVAS